MARLVFIALLDSMGFWALPLPLALHRQRHALASMLEGSAAIGTPDHLIAFMMTVCEEALAAGKLMLHDAMQERQRLHDALTRAGVPGDRAVCTTLELLANAFVNTRHDTDFWNAAFQEDAAELHRLGLIDRLRLGWKTYWSSPVARELAAFRPWRQVSMD